MTSSVPVGEDAAAAQLEHPMTMPTLKDRKGLPIAKEAIDGLASTLAGRAVRPGDADYEQARRIWNAHVQKHPGLIVRCAGTADVVQAVKFARSYNVLIRRPRRAATTSPAALCATTAS